MPKVSVIIPAYNCAKFIDQTIKSVQNQTYEDWELLLIDDGSTDDTSRVVTSIQSQDPRVRYIYQPNFGASTRAKNVGLKESIGQYVAFLDHDDEWLPNKITRHLEIFENPSFNNVGLSATNIMIVNKEDGSRLEHKMPQRGESLERLLERNFIFCSSGVMVRREVIERVGFFDENFKLGDDWDMWLRIALVSELAYIYEPLYYFNRHSGTVTNNIKTQIRIEDYEYGIKKHFEVYKRYPKQLSYRLLTMGRVCYIAGARKKGLLFFLKSIKANPIEWRAYINLFFAILGPFFYNIFLSTRYKFRNSD